MARAWFFYTKTDAAERLIASNYSATVDNPTCPQPNPVNICAVLATISATQPVLTSNLQAYLNAACIFAPCNDQPVGAGVKKYVLVRAQ